jgi:hypothetical protein
MFTRIGTVVLMLLSTVWLCRSPDWEPLIATVSAILIYVGTEVAQYKKSKQDAKERHELIEEIASARSVKGAYARAKQTISDMESGSSAREMKQLRESVEKAFRIKKDA